MKKPPQELNRMVDRVLAYRPGPKAAPKPPPKVPAAKARPVQESSI